jgi:hypothetical protein
MLNSKNKFELSNFLFWFLLKKVSFEKEAKNVATQQVLYGEKRKKIRTIFFPPFF